MRRCTQVGMSLALAALVVVPALHADLVYNVVRTTPTDAIILAHETLESSSTDERPQGVENEAQVAQRLTLTGSARRVTRIELWVGGFGAGFPRNVRLVPVLRVFAPDGSGTNAIPGSLLFEGRTPDTTIAFTTGGGGGSARVPVVYNMDIIVPNTIFVAVAHENIRVDGPVPWPSFGNACVPGGASPLIADPWLFTQSTSTGQWRRDLFGSTNNFAIQARITAVRACPADFDDGSGSGVPDGGVTIDDLLYYLILYADGRSNADLDDGTGTGNRDGGVTIEDLLYFLTRFETGC